MLVILGATQLLQNLTSVLFRQIGNVVNAALPDFQNDLIHHLFWNDGGFLGLKLVEDLVEVVDLLVGVIVPLLGWITEGRKIRDHQCILLRSARRTDQNAFRTNLFPSHIAGSAMFSEQLSCIGAIAQLHTRNILVKDLLLGQSGICGGRIRDKEFQECICLLGRRCYVWHRWSLFSVIVKQDVHIFHVILLHRVTSHEFLVYLANLRIHLRTLDNFCQLRRRAQPFTLTSKFSQLGLEIRLLSIQIT